MKKIKFSKMQSLGNDFIVIYETAVISEIFNFKKSQIRRLADRKRGIGADQILLVKKLDNSEEKFQYKIFNADGGEVEQCGNGARCVKKFLFDKGFWTDSNLILVAQQNELSVQSKNNKDFTVSLKIHGTQPADVGLDSTISKKIGKGKYCSYEIKLTEDFSTNLYLVSMGNPHGVCWEAVNKNLRLKQIFEMINAAKAFHNGVNIEFCKKESRSVLTLRVFERGVGETDACGSGACAAVVSGILNESLPANELIEVKMRQGSLFVKWDGDLLSPVLLSGPATTVFDGEFYV
ncbi:diaminopimelate epimerase [Betaproteobacteria bacterium]|nr:diaminopimelate epimerase [Betaproteobacteria bacterium]